MSLIRNALVVGGGLGGMACTLQLRKAGVEVDLIDIDPQWRSYGAGITITGPTLRALRSLGVLEEVKKHGGFWNGAKVHNRQGDFLEELKILPLEADIPATGGIMRPVLHKILSEKVKASGAKISLGVEVTDLSQADSGADVKLSNGIHSHYDLVVGADGIFSKTRGRIFPSAIKPHFTGQGCWRLVAEQPPGFDKSHFYMGTDRKVGFNPVSPTHMYMFLLERTPDNPWVAPEDQPRRLYDLMEGFGGVAAQIRDSVLESDTINYRPLEVLLLPLPWHVGRVTLVGDAVHATTPHLASGAGMAIEDGLVLGEELERGESVEEALTAYEQRRYERCRLVVENSIKLGELEMNNGPAEEHGRLMAQTIEALRQAI